jgi:hypothetical protein
MLKRPRDTNRIIKKILKRVNRPVSFSYPAGEEHKHGVLVDRAVVRSNPGTRGVPYWDVVDLIEFKAALVCRAPDNRTVAPLLDALEGWHTDALLATAHISYESMPDILLGSTWRGLQ